MAKKSEKTRKKPYYPEIIRLSLVAGVGFMEKGYLLFVGRTRQITQYAAVCGRRT